ncbi:MAG: TonB-dependent receptor [Rhodocyclaceae bacterium]|nr:TonB-dependent receptor [Rhodocyclaceae bacterium]MDZ4215888.1 TonB-dependent receptor [Rhodocyclaceae bacterium]
MNVLQRFGLAFCLVLWISLPARAEIDNSLESLMMASLDELMSMSVTIATQTPQSASRAPAVVSVISAEDIRATGATNVLDVLQSVPGITLRLNHFAHKPLVSVRGAAPKLTLMMINGAPLRDLVWGTGIYWRGLPVSMIERIEVIRGPGSALYGADAASGVINIVTKTAGRMRGAEAGVRLGSFDTQNVWLQHGTNWHGFDIGLTIDALTTDGHRPEIAVNKTTYKRTERADYGYDNLDLRLSVSRDNWRVLADHRAKDNLRVGLTGGRYFDDQTRASENDTGLAWLYSNTGFGAHWGLDAEVRYRVAEYSSGNGFFERPGVVNHQRSAEQRFSAEISSLYRGWQNHALRIGGGYVWQDIYADSKVENGVPAVFVPETDRRNAYLFAQDIWTLSDRWEVTAGARYDHYADFGGTFNPRLAVVWHTTERLTTKLMAGRAFRAPSFFELYANTGATTPNPLLKPEKSDTVELAFAWRASRDLNLNANLFHARQSNPIVAIDPFPQKFFNVDAHVIRGLELEAQWQASPTLRLQGNLTVRRADQEQFTRFKVVDHFAIPNRDAYLRADWAFLPKWNWNLQANWTGKRPHQASTDTRPTLGSNWVADTTLRYYHGSEWEFAASIRNLFNTDARVYSTTDIPNYLPLPRRSVFAEVRYKF